MTREKASASQPRLTRWHYSLLGAAAGFALGIAAIALAASSVDDRGGALFLAGGMIFGAIAGFDLHSTAAWRTLGRFRLPVRLALSCSTAAAFTALLGVPLGIVAASAIWQWALVGAVIGLCLGLESLDL